VQGAIFYPLLGTSGILVSDNDVSNDTNLLL
jgi:hypothetical protein